MPKVARTAAAPGSTYLMIQIMLITSTVDLAASICLTLATSIPVNLPGAMSA